MVRYGSWGRAAMRWAVWMREERRKEGEENAGRRKGGVKIRFSL